MKRAAHPHLIVLPPPRPKVLILNSLLVEAIQHQVYKNAKTHNVYRRCLCFIFDQTLQLSYSREE